MLRWTFILRFALITALSCFIVNAYAVGAGFYLGLQLGPSTNSAKQQTLHGTFPPTPATNVIANSRSNQFGFGFVIGNQINRYVGFEADPIFFTNIHYQPNNATRSPSATARVRALTLTAKGILPLVIKNVEFDFFGKAGAAATYLTTSGAFNFNGRSTYKTGFRPTVSVGVGYALNQRWVAEASWTRIMVGSVVNNIDFYALGFTYHYVDVYCGQFLCDD